MAISVQRQKVQTSTFTADIIPGSVYEDPSNSNIFYLTFLTKTPPFGDGVTVNTSLSISNTITLAEKGGTGSDSLRAVLTAPTTSPNAFEDVIIGDVIQTTLSDTSPVTTTVVTRPVYKSGLSYFVVSASDNMENYLLGSVVTGADIPTLTGASVVVDRVDPTEKQVFLADSVTGNPVNFTVTGDSDITVNPGVRVVAKPNGRTLELSVNYTGSSPATLNSLSVYRALTELPVACFRFSFSDSSTPGSFLASIDQSAGSSNQALINARTASALKDLTYEGFTSRGINLDALLNLVGNKV
ncbi:MAG: hypothetical protein CV045_07410 [Cyanobacteria bacterium M5B4]|nr:MAG: hypothetical protein CV045_07410 [Cyanobacteria bacterium M5B4]